MYKITPLRANVLDPLTGSEYPKEGVIAEVLLPPHHQQERSGDVSLASVKEQKKK
jgi:hypothetical protein